MNPAVHHNFAVAAQAEKERREQVREALQACIGELASSATPPALNELLAQGASLEDAAAQLGISRATAYRWKGTG